MILFNCKRYIGEHLVNMSNFGDFWMICTYIHTSDLRRSCSEEGPLFEGASSRPLCPCLLPTAQSCACLDDIMIDSSALRMLEKYCSSSNEALTLEGLSRVVKWHWGMLLCSKVVVGQILNANMTRDSPFITISQGRLILMSKL